MEWCARTYGWRLDHILWELPAVQAALLYRQWALAVAGSKAVTLMEEEVWAVKMKGHHG